MATRPKSIETGSKPISITLPGAMLREVDDASQREHRTRSELIREALRYYLFVRHLPVVEPTHEELKAIRAGEAEIARGEYVTLEELTYDMGIKDRKKSRKRTKATPKAR